MRSASVILPRDLPGDLPEAGFEAVKQTEEKPEKKPGFFARLFGLGRKKK